MVFFITTLVYTNQKLFSNQFLYKVHTNFPQASLCGTRIRSHSAKDTHMSTPPNINIQKKSAVRPRNDPSSNMRQYRYVKIMLNRKLKPTAPKNRKHVTSRHTLNRAKQNLLQIKQVVNYPGRSVQI